MMEGAVKYFYTKRKIRKLFIQAFLFSTLTDFPNGKALTFRFGMKVRSDKECQLWFSNYLNFLRIFVPVF